MKIVLDYTECLKYLPTLRTKDRTTIPTGEWNYTISSDYGALTTIGPFNCMLIAVLVDGNRPGILTHSEYHLLHRNLSDIEGIIGRPRPRSDVAALYRSATASETIDELRKGLDYLFPDSQIELQSFQRTIDFGCLDVEEKTLFAFEQQPEQ